MTKLSWKDYAELIGIAAIVASLIFVGLQMQQSQEIAQSAVYQDRTATSVELQTSSMGSSEYLSGWAKLESNQGARLTAEERTALFHYFYASMKMFDNNHTQYLNGFLPEEHWGAFFEELRCLLETPLFLSFVDLLQYRDSFRAVIVDAIEESRVNPTGCFVVSDEGSE